jgi:hypothetical protein
MYETMIDRPALVYDTLASLASTIANNISLLCPFLVEQLNYTDEQCRALSNASLVLFNQVGRSSVDIDGLVRVRRHVSVPLHLFQQDWKSIGIGAELERRSYSS